MLGVYAIVGTADHGWGSAHTLGWGGASLALLARVPRCSRRGSRTRSCRSASSAFRGLAGAAVVRAFVFTGMFAVFFFGALYLEQVRDLSPLVTGVAFLPMTLTVAALSLGPVARLVVRFGPRPVLLAGLCTLIAGLVLFADRAGRRAVLPAAAGRVRRAWASAAARRSCRC